MTVMATTTEGLSEQQRTYLRVLAILHYVHGALIALIALAMLVAFGFGLIGSPVFLLFWASGKPQVIACRMRWPRSSRITMPGPPG